MPRNWPRLVSMSNAAFMIELLSVRDEVAGLAFSEQWQEHHSYGGVQRKYTKGVYRKFDYRTKLVPQGRAAYKRGMNVAGFPYAKLS